MWASARAVSQVLRRRLRVCMAAMDRWAAPTVALLLAQVTGSLALAVVTRGSPAFIVWAVVCSIALLLVLFRMAHVTLEYGALVRQLVTAVQSTRVRLAAELVAQVQLLASSPPDAVTIAGVTVTFSLVARFSYIAGSAILVIANVRY